MKLNNENFTCAVLAMGTIFTCAVLGKTLYKVENEKAALESVKKELLEKDPAKYAITMEKAGSMTDTESKTFIWEQALKEVNDSLRNNSSMAYTNYAKGGIIK